MKYRDNFPKPLLLASLVRSDRTAFSPAELTVVRRRKREGFNLIELLIVIAIIALLVTITVPSLGRAKDQARSAVCAANVRRLAVGANTYATKYDDFLPPHRLPKNPDGSVYVNEYGRQKPRWPWFLHEEAGPVIEKSQYPTDAEFQAATEMSNDNFICPSMNDQYARDIRNGAYGYNHAYLGSGRPNPKYTDRYVPMNWPVRIGRIFNPAETVMFGDSRGAINGPSMSIRQHAYTLDAPRLAVSLGFTHFGPKNNIDPSVPEKYMHSPADARHLGLANIAFVDGHAGPMRLQDLGYELDDDGLVTKDAGDNELWTHREDNRP